MPGSTRSNGALQTVRVAVCTAGLAVLSACAMSGNGGGPTTAVGQPAASAEIIGAGPVRVALLLPRSGPGNAAATATAFRNAAELALRDLPDPGIHVAVYDTAGTPAGAQRAVGLALQEGAEIVLGPVFSAEVAAAASPARLAGTPVVAFSSDAGVAGPGVYLMSFLPADDIGQVVAFAASQGRKSFAALLPAGAYGAVAEAAFRRAVAGAGGRIVAIETYGGGGPDIAAKTAAIARIAPQIDALLVPEGGDAAPAASAALAANGVTRDRLKLLGSGQWDDPRILNNGGLVGSWFAGPPSEGFQGFSLRYQAAYGTPPPRNATLAYDAAVLAAGLVRQFGAAGVQGPALTGATGFAGVDGVFRFGADGVIERRLALYEVTGSGARAVAPAPRSFGGGS